MKFFDYITNFRLEKRNKTGLFQAGEKITPQMYYTDSLIHQVIEVKQDEDKGAYDRADGTRQFIHQILGELYFEMNGRPYVKIYPKMANMLSQIRLNVPWSILKLPYPAFEIKFSQDEQSAIREHEGNPRLQSIFVQQSMESIDDTSRPLSVRIYDRKTQKIMKSDLFQRIAKPTDGDYINVTYIMGNEKGETLDYYIWIKRSKDHTIAETLSEIAKSPGIDWSKDMPVDQRPLGGYQSSVEFHDRIMSLVLSTCLMVNGENENVLPDLPRRLMPRYEQSKSMPPEKREAINKELIERAKQLNHFGVTIGQGYEVEIPRPIHERSEEANDGVGHELQWMQIRSPHPRLQPYGSRDNPMYKVIIIPLTLVRPDLPPNPNPPVRNYRITDRSIE